MKNNRGCDIKPCCASCMHRVIKAHRICSLTNGMVSSDDCCDGWEMDERLQNAGRGGGVVRDILTKEVILH